MNIGKRLEEDLILHLEVAGENITDAIALIKDGKALTAHEKLEMAMRRLLAAEGLYKPKKNFGPTKIEQELESL